MAPISKLLPLIVLALGIVVTMFVGYVIYTIVTDIADKTSKKMERKNVSFGKEGLKIGVKEVKTENYVDQTQRCVYLMCETGWARVHKGCGIGSGGGFTFFML